ncbi:hypothetical protein Tel_09315 [Candidatus Tenderia electrophaga]|jgi:vacuolar-type H+-ATPase subunit H|uniref:Uncharacterized protein n=1 Tax=Candidatus Tenderia electrophaga TaxID=1748243 RepID=A0A0S2TDY0_9GAMM|nr:hypothetical protein Tel_09315 [Candidatus Tenderia electrophaga]
MDIEKILRDMAQAANNAVKDDVGEITEYAKQIIDNEKQSLEELGKARLRGEIDDAIFDSEVERQKKVVEVEMLTIQIMTKAAAQKAVNAALDTFKRAIKALV